jgi:putative transposase
MTWPDGYRALDVGRSRAYALINQLSAHEPVDCLCEVFDVTRSSYYAHRLRRLTPDVERLRLRSRVNELFTRGRSAPGSRSITLMMQDEGEQIGRFKVRRLMRELELVSKQPGSHAYKKATVERLDIPNILNREFDVEAPNQVWCGDITYIWAQGKWHYLAVVLDLYARRVVGWAYPKSRMQIWWSRRWTWLMSNVESLKGCCFTRIRGLNTLAASSANGYGVIACARA